MLQFCFQLLSVSHHPLKLRPSALRVIWRRLHSPPLENNRFCRRRRQRPTNRRPHMQNYDKTSIPPAHVPASSSSKHKTGGHTYEERKNNTSLANYN